MEVYPALPEGDKYEVVLYKAEHSASTDRRGDKVQRNPNHHKVILALSTAFWDTYVAGSEEAQNWLKSPKPQELMEEKDRWQKNKHYTYRPSPLFAGLASVSIMAFK